MLSHTFRLSRQITSSRVAAVSCSYLRSNFASGPEFTNEADTFVKAAATLKSKPSRVDQVKAFAESKEAARAIAEKMSGEAINWSKEETKARNNLKRKMMEWGKGHSACQHLSAPVNQNSYHTFGKCRAKSTAPNQTLLTNAVLQQYMLICLLLADCSVCCALPYCPAATWLVHVVCFCTCYLFLRALQPGMA